MVIRLGKRERVWRIRLVSKCFFLDVIDSFVRIIVRINYMIF